ncbi:MAG TPA: hypothetical protein VIK94_02655 [Bacilli bacterium]
MKKIFSVFMLALLLFVVAGCGGNKERTYVADGTYMAWKLTTQEVDITFPDSTKKKVNTPAYITVAVTIHNDEVVGYYIDERQATATPEFDENGNITNVTFAFNDRTKKELGYDYSMEWMAPQGEWFIQAGRLERAWLKNNKVEAVSSVTITDEDYIEVANAALQKAKDGKVGAITVGEHYDYDVVWVEADIDANGKISNVVFDSQLFGRVSKQKEGIYNPASADYLKFDWDPETKYESYPAMGHGDANAKRWQDQIDTFTDYVNENGWDGSIVPNATAGSTRMKGVNAGGEAIEALASVTIEVKGEIAAINMLHNFFPFGWDE